MDISQEDGDVSENCQERRLWDLMGEIKNSLFNLGGTSDMKISCGDGIFSTHRLILASLSDFLGSILRELGEEEEAILIIPDVDNKRLESFLKILYGVEENRVIDHQLVQLFHLFGIDIEQFLEPSPVQDESEPMLQIDLNNQIISLEDIETSFERFASRKGNQPSPIKGLQVSPIKGLQASPEKGLQTSPAKGLQTSPNKPDLFIIKIDDTGVGNVLGFENQEVEGGYKRCPVCSKMCNSEGVFDYHQVIHSEQFKLKQEQGECIICDKKFTKDYLLAHVREMHMLTNKYVCSKCGKQFGRKEKLEGHLSSAHGAPMRYICNICGKLFSIDSDLYKHRSQVHLAKPSLPCDACGKLFKTKERLKRHQQSHYMPKPLACVECNKVFSRKDKLNAHMRAAHLQGLNAIT